MKGLFVYGKMRMKYILLWLNYESTIVEAFVVEYGHTKVEKRNAEEFKEHEPLLSQTPKTETAKNLDYI